MLSVLHLSEWDLSAGRPARSYRQSNHIYPTMVAAGSLGYLSANTFDAILCANSPRGRELPAIPA